MVLELLQQEILQLFRVVHRQRGHHIEGTLGMAELDAGELLQRLHHRIPAAAVLLPDGVVIRLGRGAVHGGSAHLVQCGSAQPTLADLHGLFHQLLIAGNEGTHPSTAGGEPLGHGVNDGHILGGILKLQHRAELLPAVYDLPVYLVADEQQVVLLGNVRQKTHLLRAQYHTGGVAGVGDHDRPGVLVDQRLDLFPGGVAIALLRLGGNGADHTAGNTHKSGVIGIEGLGEQNLIALVQDAGEYDLQRLAAAVGRHDVIAGNGEPQVDIVVPHCLQIHLHAGRRSVGQYGLAEVPDGVKEGLWRLNVRLADIQVIDLASLCLCLHHVGVELSDGREFARFDLAGRLHVNDLLRLMVQLLLPYHGGMGRCAADTGASSKKTPLTTVRGEKLSRYHPDLSPQARTSHVIL